MSRTIAESQLYARETGEYEDLSFWVSRIPDTIPADLPAMRDTTARRVACEWHGGQVAPSYALCSSGAIVEGIGRELIETLREVRTPSERRTIARLLRYVARHGRRGAVSGWGRMTW